MRHAQNLVPTARALEIIERLIIATAKEGKVSDVSLDLGLRYRHTCVLCLSRSFFVQRCRRSKSVKNRMSVGETVVDRRQLFLILNCDEAFARRGVKRFRFTILIAAKVEIADVVLDLSGRE